MVWLGAMVLGLLLGLASRGTLGNLAGVRFRWPWVVIAALVVRMATVLTPLHSVEGAQYLYTATLAGLVAWTLWHINRITGIWLVGAGSALNLIVIVANGGRMPVAREISSALAARGQIGQYVVMSSDTSLNWLADWIVLPGFIGTGTVDAYSPGDLIVALGIAVVIVFAMRSKRGVGENRTRIVSDPP